MSALRRHEQVMLELVAENPRNNYLELDRQIPHTSVRSRDTTGAGQYVNLHVDERWVARNSVEDQDSMPSADYVITVASHPDGLGFYVDVTRGLLNFIEVFTYGDDVWDGHWDDVQFIPVAAD